MKKSDSKISNGKGWISRLESGIYILSVNDQANLMTSFHDFIQKHELTAGKVSGIGAVNRATLRFFDPETKKYIDREFKEQMELANLTGNISMIEDKPVAHLHATFGRRDYTALAGHLLDASIRGACELFVKPIEAVIEKQMDSSIG